MQATQQEHTKVDKLGSASSGREGNGASHDYDAKLVAIF